MSIASLDETQIKELFKQAMVELLQERRELFYELFTEVLEDFALVHANQEGETSESVRRDEVFQILEPAG